MSAGVLLLRPEHAGDSTDQLELRLRDHGIPVYRQAMVRLQPTPPEDQQLDQWLQQTWDGIIVVSPNAARIFQHQLGERSWPAGAYYGVGPGTAAQVNELAGRALTYPASQHNSEALLQLPELTEVQDQKWLCLTAAGGRDVLPRTLAERGARVTVAELYERQPIPDALGDMAEWQDQVAIIAVTSAQQAKLFQAAAQKQAADWLAERHWVVPSERIAEQLNQAGIARQQIHLADSALPEAMSRAVQQLREQLGDTTQSQTPKAPRKKPQKRRAKATATKQAESVASTSDHQPEPATAEPKTTGRIGALFLWLLVLSLLGSGSVGGWWLWQEQQALATETERRLSDFREQLAEQDRAAEPADASAAQEARWDEFQQEMTGLISDRLSDERATNRQQLRDLRDRSAAERDAMQTEIDDQARQLTRVNEQLRNLSDQDRSGWYLVEAYDLVTAASHRVWYDYDTSQAVELLDTARDLLVRQSDSRYQPLIRQLERDIELVEELEVADTEAMTRELQSLQSQLRDLPLRDGAKAGEQMAPAREASSELSEWRENLARAWENFSSDVIRIQRVDEHQVALAADQRAVMLASQELQLQLAQQAAISRDQDYYQQSLDLVAQALEQYFDASASSVQQFQDRLAHLQSQSVEPISPPNLLSRAMLRDRVEELQTNGNGR